MRTRRRHALRAAHRFPALPAMLGILLLAWSSAGCDRQTEASGNAGAAAPVAVTAALRPDGPLAEGTSCVSAECHARFLTAQFIHGPVASGDCQACHQEDVGGHSYPLKREGDRTCTFCHAAVAEPGTMLHQHPALEQGCTACHDPHISRAKFLLTGDNVSQVCQNCHQTSLKSFGHEPFVKGECSLCHQPHQSDNPHLLRAGDTIHQCATCHGTLLDAMAGASHLHHPATGSCTTCHHPHTSSFPHQLNASVGDTCTGCHQDMRQKIQQSAVTHGALTLDEQCANCHNPHASADRTLLRDRTDTLCMECHNQPIRSESGRLIADMTPALRDAQFLHGPIRAGDCAVCHMPHGGQNDRLLTRPFPKTFYARFHLENYALCFTCHEPELVLTERTGQLTGFRDGQINLHFLHVNRSEKGRTCNTCHEIHGSNQPAHMADSVPFEGSGWSMPIRFEKSDEGGSCAPGCHGPRTYVRRDGGGESEGER